MPIPRRIAILTGLAVLLGLALVLASGAVDWFASPEDMAIWLRGIGAWAPLAVVLLMILHSVVPFPAELLAACAGAVFGTVLGSVLVWIGAMLGAALSFWLARRFGRILIDRFLPARHAEALDKWSVEQGTLALLISRFIPVIAFNLINYSAGLTRVGFGTFLWTTALGILPITILSAWLGAHMISLSWPMLLTVSACGIIVVGFGHVLWRRKRG